MNWFERHINWTVVLNYVLITMVVYMLAVEDSFTDYSFGSWVIWLCVWTLFIWIWALRKKKRSLWWLLSLFLPYIGGFIILLLSNKRTAQLKAMQGSPKAGALQSPPAHPPGPKFCPHCGKPIGTRRRYCASCGEPVSASARKHIEHEKAEIIDMIEKATSGEGGGR